MTYTTFSVTMFHIDTVVHICGLSFWKDENILCQFVFSFKLQFSGSGLVVTKRMAMAEEEPAADNREETVDSEKVQPGEHKD